MSSQQTALILKETVGEARVSLPFLLVFGLPPVPSPRKTRSAPPVSLSQAARPLPPALNLALGLRGGCVDRQCAPLGKASGSPARGGIQMKALSACDGSVPNSESGRLDWNQAGLRHAAFSATAGRRRAGSSAGRPLDSQQTPPGLVTLTEARRHGQFKLMSFLLPA